MATGAARAFVVLAVLSGALTQAQVPAAPSLGSLAWLSGQWSSEEGGQLSEETWSVAHGTSMVGMWRLVIDGTPRVLELLSLTVEGEDVVLRLRHFDAKLVAREEKGAPLVLKLVESGERRAAFRGAGTKGPLTITYAVEGDNLVGTVKHGDEALQAYRMRRLAARAARAPRR